MTRSSASIRTRAVAALVTPIRVALLLSGFEGNMTSNGCAGLKLSTSYHDQGETSKYRSYSRRISLAGRVFHRVKSVSSPSHLPILTLKVRRLQISCLALVGQWPPSTVEVSAMAASFAPAALHEADLPKA